MATKYDYISLRQQYIQTPGLSIRELCRQNDIPTWSTVNKKANDEGWDAKRQEFERQVESRSMEHLAQKRANKIAEIQIDALEVIHAGILKLAADMDAREPVMDGDKLARNAEGEIIWRPVNRYTPSQFATLIEKFQTLIGAPSQIGEHRNLGLNLSAETDDETLRGLLAAVRSRAAIAGASGPDQEPDPKNARTN